MTTIPYDIDETITEYRLTIPLGGVDPTTLTITYNHETHEITITGTRSKPSIVGEYKQIHAGCYRGHFHTTIACPPHATGERTQTLSQTNILILFLPKKPMPRSHIILE